MKVLFTQNVHAKGQPLVVMIIILDVRAPYFAKKDLAGFGKLSKGFIIGL